MKRLIAAILATLSSLMANAQFFAGLQSSNPPTATGLVTRDLQARTLKLNPATQQLITLSSNNTVSWLNAATLATEHELDLGFGALDIAISENADLLFVASPTNHAVYRIRLSDLQMLDSVALDLSAPYAIESLPGSPNGFAVLVTNEFNTRMLRIFHDGAELQSDPAFTNMIRGDSNIFAYFDQFDGSYRADIRLGDDGRLAINKVRDGNLFRQGYPAYDGARIYLFPITSVAFDKTRIYTFGGSVDVRISSYDISFPYVVPTTALILDGIAGPPSHAVRWGDDGLAFIAKGVVATLRSTIVPSVPRADLSIKVTGFSGITGGQVHPRFTLHNEGPAAATDIRVLVDSPYPAMVDFSYFRDATPQRGSIVPVNFGYGFYWYLDRLESGESVSADATFDAMALGPGNVQCIALHAEGDPTPEDTNLVEPYAFTLDPAKTDLVQPAVNTVWNGGLGGAIYLAAIDREIGVGQKTIDSLNLHSGETVHVAPISQFAPRIVVNDLDPSTFLTMHGDFTLYSAATMQPLWTILRDGWSDDPERANFYDVTCLMFTGLTTNFVLSYQPLGYPPPPYNLLLYVGPTSYPTRLQGGNQLFRTGSSTFLSYSGGQRGFLQSIRIDGTNLIQISQWTDLMVGREMDYKNGIIYSADGRTYDAATMQSAGTFTGIQNPQSVRAYPAVDRVVFVMDGALGIYELSTRQSLGVITSPAIAWRYVDIPHSLDFSAPDTLFLSSASSPVIVRTSLMRDLTPTIKPTGPNTIEVSFFSVPGRSYSIESTDSLPAASWKTEMQTAAGGSVKQTITISDQARFFRVHKN